MNEYNLRTQKKRKQLHGADHQYNPRPSKRPSNTVDRGRKTGNSRRKPTSNRLPVASTSGAQPRPQAITIPNTQLVTQPPITSVALAPAASTTASITPATPQTPEMADASTSAKLDLILENQKRFETRLNNVEDCINQGNQAAASSAASNMPPPRPLQPPSRETHVVDLSDEDSEDSAEDMRSVFEEEYPPSHRSDNSYHRGRPYDRRSEGGRHYKDFRRPRDPGNSRNHFRRHSQVDRSRGHQGNNGGYDHRPRRSSTPGTHGSGSHGSGSGSNGSSLSEAQRKEIIGIVNNTMSSNQAHEEEAAYQIIVYGLPIISGDDLDKEIEKALPFINEATKCVNGDIDWVDRFPSRSDDGTYPMIVRFKDRIIPDRVWEAVKANRAAFPWYQKSLARHIRRWNSKMEREAKRLNSGTPDSEPTIWEAKLVGDLKILRQIANPRYIPPAQAGNASNRRLPGPMFRYPTHQPGSQGAQGPASGP